MKWKTLFKVKCSMYDIKGRIIDNYTEYVVASTLKEAKEKIERYATKLKEKNRMKLTYGELIEDISNVID